ncbi:MAG: sigma-70 family RNA polymerase sigma factor [Cystobacter sp.]
MSSQASPGDVGSSTRRTRTWQLVLVAVAFAAFFRYVFLPIGGIAALFSVLVGFVWAKEQLEHLGALESGPFGGAMYLTGALLFLYVLMRFVLAGWSGLRQLSGVTRPLPFPLRWPWWTFGLGLLLAAEILIPDPPRGSDVPGLAGALILTLAVWGVLSFIYLSYQAFWGGMSLAWGVARVSPFGAGLLTVGALACVGIMALFGAVLEEASSQLSARPRPHFDPRCGASALECSRRLFLAVPNTQDLARGDTLSARAQPLHASASLGFPESSRGTGLGTQDTESARTRRFRECLDNQSKRKDLLATAWRIAAASIDRSDAWDLVHRTLMSVCLRAGERYDFDQYFLRSIQNGVKGWYRQPANARSCSIDDIMEPVCDVDTEAEYVRHETQMRVQQALCELPEEDKQILKLRYFDEQSELDIAQRLGISYAAARKRLQRAREKLEFEFLEQCQ